MTIRTRFAPSPTGYLHIGGVRTALFNWLLARQAGGQFILRIDDTDSKRNVEAALQPILEGFKWLGMDWDEGPDVGGPHGPYFQSQRLDKYQDAARRLLESGHAYRDYSKPEEFAAEREAAEKTKQDFVYSRTWMAETDDQVSAFESEGRSFVVRLKMPREGKCEISDLVRGDVSFDWARETDHVIQRGDGTCLYHLANVVDDHDFQITHVVRAVEHLSNTPRQVFILQSLGYDLPQYAHVPFVAEPGGKNKLSKRKIEQYLNNKDFKRLYQSGAEIAEKIGLQTDPSSFNPVLVDFYRDVGFLPDAVLNYLVLLGWSLDGETEDFSRAQMLEHFSLDRIIKSEASFDSQKLTTFQTRYMNDLPSKRKHKMCLGFLQKAEYVSDPIECEQSAYVQQIVDAAGDRICMAGDVLKFATFFTADEEFTFDDKPFQKRLVKPENAGFLLSEFEKLLTSAQEFTAKALEELLHGFCETQGIGPGDIIHALRVAVTGQAAGFGMFDTLEILGQARCSRRIKLALAELENRTNNAV
ncbi:MAG: glutamyl-tRNA synthetase [Mariniblastus sp.]|jgi:glutamyl-tRNA synthetase